MRREKLITMMRLGPSNIARVVAYRLGLKLPISPIRRVVAAGGSAHPPFFKADAEAVTATPFVLPPAFGYHTVGEATAAPDWLVNPLNGMQFQNADRPFYAIPDFDVGVGDIKQIWELSRWGWLPEMAADPERLSQANDWLADWTAQNPAYQGPNWKCGQEASIRVMHIIAAAQVSGQIDDPAKGLLDLVALHLKRIAPTVSYATAQDNNHGTSEAAALYVGGSWLMQHGQPRGKAWAQSGRRLLENRARRLIADDGGFSQYSVNYHRMMLDAYSLAEWWRGRMNDVPFSPRLHMKLKAASLWLYRLTDAVSGDVPNMGANDGAHILNLSRADYRDYRPSVAMSAALWHKASAFVGASSVEKHFSAWGLDTPTATRPAVESTAALNSGFATLNNGTLNAVLRVPRFAFRPSQSDILHLDITVDGQNVLRDAGTYSYNSSPKDLAYFGGSVAHNTVQFDGRDAMPRLSRFLFGAWPKVERFEYSADAVTAAYTDYAGAKHRRSVIVSERTANVTDMIAGFKNRADLRWRFAPGLWNTPPTIEHHENGLSLRWADGVMDISATMPITAAWELGSESRYYLYKSPLDVLCITAATQGTLTTKIRFHP